MFEQLQMSLAQGAPVAFVIGAGLSALLLFWGVAALMGRTFSPARRRLGEMADGLSAKPRQDLSERVDSWMRPFARVLLPKGSELASTQQRLMFAGYPGAPALTTFYGVKLALALALPIIWLVVTHFLPKITSQGILFGSLATCFFGMILPGIWLDRKVAGRQRRLREGFPDALDLLTVCVESGLGLAQALQRVADELDVSHPDLASELAHVTGQMRAGVEREAALKTLASRTGMEDIRGLVGLLVQTLRFGTGIADALRVYSEEFRDRRMQRAEEEAAKLGTKMIFPLVFCLFPSFFVVAVGPAVIRLSEAFGGK